MAEIDRRELSDPLHIQESQVTGWSPWFAWHPVRTVEGRWLWFITVKRRMRIFPKWFWYNATHVWEYR